jgi:hypothetical protein
MRVQSAVRPAASASPRERGGRICGEELLISCVNLVGTNSGT